jgi:hypothetical protein
LIQNPADPVWIIPTWYDLGKSGNDSPFVTWGGLYSNLEKFPENGGNFDFYWFYRTYAGRNVTQNLPSGTCTILCWCSPNKNYFDGPDTYNGLVSWGTRTNGTPSNAVLLSVNALSYPTIYVSSAYWYNDYVPNSLIVKTSEWNMVGLIARQGAITNNTTLICGNSLGLNYSTGTSSNYTKTLNFTNANLRIGCTDAGGTRRFDGKVVSVMIYNRELSTNEIERNYAAMKPRLTPYLGYW